MEIRDESLGDVAGIRGVHLAAFAGEDSGGAFEAGVVDGLRRAGELVVSLVGVAGDEIVGHVALSPVRIEGAAHRDDKMGESVRGAGRDSAGRGEGRESGAALAGRVLGLGPIGVVPSHQGQGVGSALTLAAIDRARALAAGGIVLVGEPGWYGRFGFARASEFGLVCEFDVPSEAFVGLELAGFGGRGKVVYSGVFGGEGSRDGK